MSTNTWNVLQRGSQVSRTEFEVVSCWHCPTCPDIPWQDRMLVLWGGSEDMSSCGQMKLRSSLAQRKSIVAVDSKSLCVQSPSRLKAPPSLLTSCKLPVNWTKVNVRIGTLKSFSYNTSPPTVRKWIVIFWLISLQKCFARVRVSQSLATLQVKLLSTPINWASVRWLGLEYVGGGGGVLGGSDGERMNGMFSRNW
jgi:hypothetical protein